MAAEKKVEDAERILEDFSKRTGINEATGNEGRRYLWTDAIAVQALFSLYSITKEDKFRKNAIRTIELVHDHLSQYHPDDPREGRISGLDDNKAKLRPTLRGLRIGKSLPERQEDESYNSQLEWERDGQYFHYITRWIAALLRAHKETGEEQYANQASDLFIAAGNFIYEKDGNLQMYWKMDTTLSRPLVPSMGAHDPLEGILCGKSIQQALVQENPEVNKLVEKFGKICENRDWSTRDPLGIGALLLNTVYAAELINQGTKIPPAATPEKLFDTSLSSLKRSNLSLEEEPAARRLAFRECGLSLGINACIGKKEELSRAGLDPSRIGKYAHLADEIEDFWLNPVNQKSRTWTDHLDINAVTLAASLVGDKLPG